MKKTFLINRQFLTISLVVLVVFFIPILIYAGTFYTCTDKKGNDSLSSYPVDGQTCVEFRTDEEKTSKQGDNKTIIPPDDNITKIIVKGNQVLVPVTLIYDSNEVNVHLLLDTGASGTTIYTNIADQLYINLNKAKKAKGKVVGGSIIDANIITINSLKVGPHTFYKRDIFIVHQEASTAKSDGLLGMDLLRELSYKIDFAKQIIIWE